MSQLLKAGHVTIATGRKALEARTAIQVETKRLDQRADQPHAPQSGDEQAERLKHRIAELEQAAADQVRQCETLEQAAYQRGMDEGMQLGAATVKRDHEAQLATLREGVQAALEAFAEQLRAIEPLALEMTLIALEKILGDPAAYAELIGQTTRHHLAQVTANSTVGVRVSAADFPDAEQLRLAFAPLSGHSALSVQADPQMPAGSCMIDLKLGRLDISLPQQKAHLMSALATLHETA